MDLSVFCLATWINSLLGMSTRRHIVLISSGKKIGTGILYLTQITV